MLKIITIKARADTTGAMSLADLQQGMHKKFKNLLLRNFNLPLPKTQNDLDFFANFITKNKNQLAAVFLEPILQCAGGMYFYEANILQNIAKITQENNVLLVLDECATGFYRTGKKFAHHYANIRPDILVLGKALTGGMLTLAATLVNQKIYEQFLKPDLDLALMHGPTFMGNPLACASANASLDLFENNLYEKNNLISVYSKYTLCNYFDYTSLILGAENPIAFTRVSNLEEIIKKLNT